METVIATADCEREIRSERDILPEDAPRVRAIRGLVIDAVETADHENWDGEGASPIDRPVVEHAMHIADWIEARGLPLPRVEPDPEGRVCFIWEPARGRLGVIEARPGETLFLTCYDSRIGKNEYGRLERLEPPEEFARGIHDLHGE